jgi:hypothetical protein
VQVYGGHKSNFDGHSKRSISNIMAFAIVYQPQCMRIFPSLPVETGEGLFAEAYINNTCILASAGDMYLDLGSPCTPGAGLFAQIVLANNTILAPEGNGSASVHCGNETLSFDAWVATGSDPGTTLGAVPPSALIIEWARALLWSGLNATVGRGA